MAFVGQLFRLVSNPVRWLPFYLKANKVGGQLTGSEHETNHYSRLQGLQLSKCLTAARVTTTVDDLGDVNITKLCVMSPAWLFWYVAAIVYMFTHGWSAIISE